MPNKTIGSCLTVCQHNIMISVYIGFSAAVVRTFTLAHRDGARHTSLIPQTVHHVQNLTFQLFRAYFVVWAGIRVGGGTHIWSGNC